MSLYRQQALIEAPVETIWELVGDVERHPEWWPHVIEVECEGLDEGCTYRMVSKSPVGTVENQMVVERLDGCRELLIRCLNTGTYCRWLLTEAQGGTFIDAEFGMDPQTVGTKVFDRLAGKRYFRRWLEHSLEALSRVAAEPARPAKAA
jgi:uncharacterized protein YndB with AHSA1/START domain